MWGLENAYRDRVTLLAKDLKEETDEVKAKLDALRKQVDASETVSKPS